VIEDEPLIAMMLEDFRRSCLATRWRAHADSVAEAIDQRWSRTPFDVAILDVHLRDGACWPVADAHDGQGTSRFVIASGGHRRSAAGVAYAARTSSPSPSRSMACSLALEGASYNCPPTSEPHRESL
jgi:DNA-binding NarL/FixJ family response regulator